MNPASRSLVISVIFLIGAIGMTVSPTRNGAWAAESDLAGSVQPGPPGGPLPISDATLIRVAISQKSSPTPCLDHDRISVRSTSGISLKDGESGTVLLRVGPDQTVTLLRSEEGVAVTLEAGGDGGAAYIKRRVVLEPSDAGGILSVPSIQRGNSAMCYRGHLEVFPSNSPGKLRLVNVLTLGDYLTSVVGAEMPEKFELEALKAQAVAARSYTVYNWNKHGSEGANLCDSVHCHVYSGVASENPKASRAVRETAGLFAIYNGEVINAVYSSTAGGYTENSENVWPGSGRVLPYLRGVPDDPDVAPVLTDEDAGKFIESSRGRFDRYSPNFRWREEWTREELEAILNETLAKRYESSPQAISPAFPRGSSIGRLVDLRVGARGVSGKAQSLIITGSSGVWTVSGELEIRYVLKPKGKQSLNSANVVLDLLKDEAGNILRVVARGAGMGHGVGLSQWGAEGMARAGYAFPDILKHYYTGITLETLPVRLVMSADPVTLGCFLPGARASVVLRNVDQEELVFRVNDEYRITLNLAEVIGKTLVIDISGYVRPGPNLFSFERGNGAGHMTVSIRAE